MNKPIVLIRKGSRWEVWMDPQAALKFRVKPKLVEPYGLEPVPISRSGERFALIPGGTPAKFSKEQAMSLAHRIGRYLLDLGDFVSTYTEERRD